MESQYLLGDAQTVLATLPPDSVQLVVTSPPYWSLKDYDHPDQIGFGESFESYLERLQGVWKESIRVLEPGCRLCINVGDQFVRAQPGQPYNILPIHSEIIKQLQDIDGVSYLGSIIWHKIGTSRGSGGGAFMGSIYHPRDALIAYEHEYIAIFKKNGRARKPSPESKEKSRLTLAQRSEWGRGMWNFPPVRKQKGHPAQFPPELPKRLIRMYTFHGETVLDPFAGSGTTLDAARDTGRHGIGVDLNPDYQWLWEGQTLNLFAG